MFSPWNIFFILDQYAEKRDALVFSEKETEETKKCLHCLKRVSNDHYRCPNCGSISFIY